MDKFFEFIKDEENLTRPLALVIALGYLMFKKSKNPPEARQHFEVFLKKIGKDAKYKSLKKEAEKYLSQIKRKRN